MNFGSGHIEWQKNKDFPEFVTLSSGNMELLYAGGDLRRIRSGEKLLLSAVYVAVRDRNWKTIAPVILEEKIALTEDGFTIEILNRYRYKKISFEAKISVVAGADSFVYKMKGVARSGFYRNRIGICVLLPVEESKGKKVEVLHSAGSRSRGVFPVLVAPHQPFKDITGMSWDAGDSCKADLHFEGDIFEMEDQRNWTDASYKIYSTPLELDFPVWITKGTEIGQSVSFSFIKERSVPLTNPGGQNILDIDTSRSFSLPRFGICKSFDKELLSQTEMEKLSPLGFSHYRVDLWMNGTGWKNRLNTSLNEYEHLGWPFELALHFDENYIAACKAFLDYTSDLQLPVSHFLVFDHHYLSGDELLGHVVPLLKKKYPGVPVGGGSDTHFAELNRNHPDTGLVDFVTYPLCPQVHASDRLTVIENIGGQAPTVERARSLFNKPVYINAVTLKERFNAVATEKGDDPSYQPEPDHRQPTVFAAAWALGSMKQLTRSGVKSVTWFETTGARGLFEYNENPQKKHLKKDKTVKLFPLYHLFKEFLNNKKYFLYPVNNHASTSVDGVLLSSGQQGKLYLVNYTGSDQELLLSGLHATCTDYSVLNESGWNPVSDGVAEHTTFVLKPDSLYMIQLKFNKNH